MTYKPHKKFDAVIEKRQNLKSTKAKLYKSTDAAVMFLFFSDIQVELLFLKSVGWKRPNKKRFIIFERLLNILKAFLCLLATINSLCTKRTEPCTLIMYSRSLVLISLEQFIHFPSNRNLTTKDVFSGKTVNNIKTEDCSAINNASMEKGVHAIVCCK